MHPYASFSQHALLLQARLSSAAGVCGCRVISTSSIVLVPFLLFLLMEWIDSSRGSASSSVWTISPAVLLLPSCSSPTPILANFRSAFIFFIFCYFFALTSIISSGLICCSSPSPPSSWPLLPFFLRTNGLIGSGSQSATPVGGKLTNTTYSQLQFSFLFADELPLTSPQPHLSSHIRTQTNSHRRTLAEACWDL